MAVKSKVLQLGGGVNARRFAPIDWKAPIASQASPMRAHGESVTARISMRSIPTRFLPAVASSAATISIGCSDD